MTFWDYADKHNDIFIPTVIMLGVLLLLGFVTWVIYRK